MSDERDSLLAHRLDDLFRLSRPAGRQWTNNEVASEIRKANPDIKVGGAYLSALRGGTRKNPSPALLAGLAKFFGVSPAYFFDSDQADRVSQQLAALDEIRRAGVKSIALRAIGLPAESLDAMAAVLDQMRKLQGLPPVREE